MGSAAIFTRWGLDSASPIALLILRFATALFVLLLIAIFRKRLLPKYGSRKQVLLTGLLIIAGYSICYFKAMAHGVTPGLMATIMGIQPILTLCLLERIYKREIIRSIDCFSRTHTFSVEKLNYVFYRSNRNILCLSSTDLYHFWCHHAKTFNKPQQMSYRSNI